MSKSTFRKIALFLLCFPASFLLLLIFLYGTPNMATVAEKKIIKLPNCQSLVGITPSRDRRIIKDRILTIQVYVYDTAKTYHYSTVDETVEYIIKESCEAPIIQEPLAIDEM